MLTKKTDLSNLDEMDKLLAPAYGRRGITQPIPKYQLPDHEMSPDTIPPTYHQDYFSDSP